MRPVEEYVDGPLGMDLKLENMCAPLGSSLKRPTAEVVVSHQVIRELMHIRHPLSPSTPILAHWTY